MGTTHLMVWMALVLIVGLVGLIIVRERYRPLLALLIVLANTALSAIPSILALTTGPQLGVFNIPHLVGDINIKIDSLSAWFILIINFTSITGVLYGSGYLKTYSHLKTNLELHWVFYILFHLSMVWVCMFDNGIAFLIAWELMSLSSLMLVIFEFQNKQTLKAGINYMVQMHLSVVLLTLGFILLYINTGSFNFEAIAQMSSNKNSIWIFVLLFCGFAIKAGFIPFHTWLPHAHPAAPSHVSGVMSGVIVKLGIYGIFRIIMYLRHDWLLFGEVILLLSVLTALYGIANAAVKYDFKQMLAYCTIENIGIIGIGLGIGLMGIGNGDKTMAVLGFSGALLHTLNHSLFKSLLFFGAGSVYQQTHTRNIERLGGLIKKMPVTAMMFLIGSMAIGGVPPFNGFVSEFIIYNGLFKGLLGFQGISQTILLVLTITGLVIVGGMSLITFTKTFGVIFLGNPRQELPHEPKEASFIMLLPQYLIVAAMLSVALVPQFFFSYANKVVSAAFAIESAGSAVSFAPMVQSIASVGKISMVFIVLMITIFGIRWLIVRKRHSVAYETWGCGYAAPVKKAQYSGQSFTRSFGLLFSFLKGKRTSERIQKEKLYPGQYSYSTHYIDILEEYFVAPLAKRLTFTLNYFQFIQNGQIQSYVLYGLFFIILVFLGTAFNLIY
ncbi:MAG: proton-conducting transporter membrane subunit [Bacteroidia bacterium]|nr:proton-conducting transporter membrane subunit [Bacteroidia bacterium]